MRRKDDGHTVMGRVPRRRLQTTRVQFLQLFSLLHAKAEGMCLMESHRSPGVGKSIRTYVCTHTARASHVRSPKYCACCLYERQACTRGFIIEDTGIERPARHPASPGFRAADSETFCEGCHPHSAPWSRRHRLWRARPLCAMQATRKPAHLRCAACARLSPAGFAPQPQRRWPPVRATLARRGTAYVKAPCACGVMSGGPKVLFASR